MAARATLSPGSSPPMSSSLAGINDGVSVTLSPDAVPFSPLAPGDREEMGSVAGQFSHYASKLRSLRGGDPASLKTQLNLLFDQLISENYSPNHNIRPEEVCALLIHVTRLVPLSQEHLVVKLCQLTHHLLNQLQVIVDEQTLDVCVCYVVRALAVCSLWTHSEVLQALSTLIYGNGPRCNRHLIELLGDGGVLRLYSDPSQPDMELRRAALTCMANLCLGVPGQASLEDPYRSVCFKVFLQTLQSPKPPDAEELLYCTVHTDTTLGNRVNEIYIVFPAKPALMDTKSEPNLIVFMWLKSRLMFQGCPGVCVEWPSVLYPAPLPQYETCSTPKPPEPPQNPPTQTSGVRDWEDEEREAEPRLQRGGRGGEAWSKTSVLPSPGVPSLYPLWKRSSSDSEFSDPEGAAHSKLRLFHGRVRQGVLLCLLAVVKAVEKRTLYGYWSSFIPEAPIGGPPPLTLLTVVLKDPSPKVRACALQVVSALLDGSRQFLGVAEDLAPARTSYTPFSFSLATAVRELHRSLSLALLAEASAHTLTQIIKCLAHLVCNAPYNRLRPGLLSPLWRQIQPYLRHRDVNVRVSVLTLYGALVSSQAPLSEVQLLLTHTSQETGLSWRQREGFSSPHTPPSHKYHNSHTPRGSHTPGEEEPGVPWLLQLCVSLVTQPKDDQSDSEGPGGGGATALEPSPVRLEALQVLAHLVRGYFPLCQACLCELGQVSARCLRETDPSIQLHGAKLLEELGTGIIQQYRPDNSQSESCRVPISQVVQFWVDVLSGPLNGALQSHQHPTLQTSACDTLSSILPQAFTQLPEKSQVLCVTVLLGLTYSDNSLVKAAAVRALGVYILFPCLREDVMFVADTANAILTALDDRSPNVRSKAAWSLGNLTDTLIVNMGCLGEVFQEELSDMLVLQMLQSATKAAFDKDRVRTHNRLFRNLILKFHHQSRKFWKAIKSMSGNSNVNELLSCVLKDFVAIYDKTEKLNCFNEHFVSSGRLFDSVPSVSVQPCVDEPVRAGQTFSFLPFSVQVVHKALKSLDQRKPAGPDLLDPCLLNLAADFIAEPLTYLFNLTLECNEIPKIWKSAFVLPLLKGGDPTLLNNYRPISKLSPLLKILETLVSEQLN
uniref:HEAT repeat-containing protein 6 n=1 Tax=Oncorhynchus tshawytscha TaxID=74940 RepID=A0AAZ3RMD0_ONCTS